VVCLAQREKRWEADKARARRLKEEELERGREEHRAEARRMRSRLGMPPAPGELAEGERDYGAEAMARLGLQDEALALASPAPRRSGPSGGGRREGWKLALEAPSPSFVAERQALRRAGGSSPTSPSSPPGALGYLSPVSSDGRPGISSPIMSRTLSPPPPTLSSQPGR
jgi:hypothetical protein